MQLKEIVWRKDLKLTKKQLDEKINHWVKSGNLKEPTTEEVNALYEKLMNVKLKTKK